MEITSMSVENKGIKMMGKEDFYEVTMVAMNAGRLAGEDAIPTPMVVEQRANPLDDSSPVVKRYAPVMDGMCGFAWVNIKPGTSAYARWLKKEGIARKDSYYGGVTIWIGEHGQSYERKSAHAAELARVLRTHGVNAINMSRLD